MRIYKFIHYQLTSTVTICTKNSHSLNSEQV